MVSVNIRENSLQLLHPADHPSRMKTSCRLLFVASDAAGSTVIADACRQSPPTASDDVREIRSIETREQPWRDFERFFEKKGGKKRRKEQIRR